MNTKCIIITNKNSWVAEPVVAKLNDALEIDLISVVFFDATGNWKLIKRRFKQYGGRYFFNKLFRIIRRKFSKEVKKNCNTFIKTTYQTVKDDNIKFMVSKDLNSENTINYINNLEPDVVFVFSCSQILSKAFLNNKNIKFINFHGSLLPRHKGPSPFFWALYDQDKKSGYTIHHIKREIDSGEILYREEVGIEDVKSEEELIRKIVKTTALSITDILKKIRSNVQFQIEFIDLKESHEGIPSSRQRKELQKKLSN